MKSLTVVSDSIKHLGQGFVLAYYLPAMIFVLMHMYVLLPAWPVPVPTSTAATTSPTATLVPTSTVDSITLAATSVPTSTVATISPTATPAPTDVADSTSAETPPLFTWSELIAVDLSISTTVGTLLVPLLVGIILVGLNSTLIRAFEGQIPLLKKYLLGHWTKSNRHLCKKLYSNLREARDEKRQLEEKLRKASDEKEKLWLMQLLGGVEEAIEEEHDKIEEELEKVPRLQTLPCDVERVGPTAFGNIYAMAEEYPYERYGVDAVLFWTRLRELMHKAAPEHSERLTQQKTMLDLLLNLAFLSGLLALEAVFLLLANLIVSQLFPLSLLFLVVVSVILFRIFYQASVGAVRVMGELIKNSFDYHRGLILDSFNLQPPTDLSTEQVIWIRLTAFIRRGDEFYFPAEFLKPEDQDDKNPDKKKKPNKAQKSAHSKKEHPTWLRKLLTRLPSL